MISTLAEIHVIRRFPISAPGRNLAGLDELRGILICVVKSRTVQGTTERGAQLYIEHRSDRVTPQWAAFHGASSNPANLSVLPKRFL